MARKDRKKKEDVDSYRHEADTRKNAAPVVLASYDTSRPKPKRYDYDPHLDPLSFFPDSSAWDRLRRALTTEGMR